MYHASMGFCAYNFTLASPTHTIPLSPRPRSSCPYDIATRTVRVFNRVKTELFIRAFLLYPFLSTSVHPVSLPRTVLYPVTISNRVSAQDSSPHPVSAQIKAQRVCSPYHLRRDHGLAWSVLLLIWRSRPSIFPQMNQTSCKGPWASFKAWLDPFSLSTALAGHVEDYLLTLISFTRSLEPESMGCRFSRSQKCQKRSYFTGLHIPGLFFL